MSKIITIIYEKDSGEILRNCTKELSLEECIELTNEINRNSETAERLKNKSLGVVQTWVSVGKLTDHTKSVYLGSYTFLPDSLRIRIVGDKEEEGGERIWLEGHYNGVFYRTRYDTAEDAQKAYNRITNALDNLKSMGEKK